MSELKPLPQPLLTAARLRAMAKELILQAQELEASVPVAAYQPKKSVTYAFSKLKLREKKK